jgi:hypothetical protein
VSVVQQQSIAVSGPVYAIVGDLVSQAADHAQERLLIRLRQLLNARLEQSQ